MSFLINSELTTKDGLIIPSGSYATMQIFIGEDKKVTIDLLIRLNESAFNEGKQSINVDDSFKIRFKRELTDTQYNNLTMSQINNFLKNRIESVVGEGNVDII